MSPMKANVSGNVVSAGTSRTTNRGMMKAMTGAKRKSQVDLTDTRSSLAKSFQMSR